MCVGEELELLSQSRISAHVLSILDLKKHTPATTTQIPRATPGFCPVRSSLRVSVSRFRNILLCYHMKNPGEERKPASVLPSARPSPAW